MKVSIACIFAGILFAQGPPPGPPKPVEGGPSLTIEEYEPKSTLVVPSHPVTRAKYPFIDIHNHQDALMSGAKLDKLVQDMDGLNLQVMVNLSGGYGDKLAQGVKNMKGKYAKRF